MARAKAEARAILDEARRTADEVFRELGDMRKKARRNRIGRRSTTSGPGLRHRLNEAEDKLGVREKAAPPPMLRPAQKGDTVTILKTGTQGTVLSVNKDGVLQLQAGILRITAKQEEVRVVEGETQTQKAARQYHPAHRAQAAQPGRQGRGGPAGHDHRRGGDDPQPVPGPGHHGQPHPGHRHPRQGNRGGAEGRAHLSETVQRGGTPSAWAGTARGRTASPCGGARSEHSRPARGRNPGAPGKTIEGRKTKKACKFL